jgi:hypothetical protein
MFRHGSDPIRSDTEAYTPSSGMDPTRLDPIPKLTHPLPAWIRSYPIRYQSFRPIRPEWIRPVPISYRSLHIFFRNGPDPVRPDPGAYTLSSGADPILSDPKPELIHLLPECMRSYPIRYRSLHIIFWKGPDHVRSDTEAYTPSSGRDPILSDPIPDFEPLLPEWI